MENNHNKNDYNAYKSLMESIGENHNKSITDNRKLLIKNNLDKWETSYTKVPNIIINKQDVLNALEKAPIKMLFCENDYHTNLAKAYKFGKIFISLGVEPKQTFITNYNDCLLRIRGYGEHETFKNDLFNPNNKVLIIEDVREIRDTDVSSNIKSFFYELDSYVKKYNITVLLVASPNHKKTMLTDLKEFIELMNLNVSYNTKARKVLTKEERQSSARKRLLKK